MTRYSENDDMKNGGRKRCAEDEKTENDGLSRLESLLDLRQTTRG